MVSIGPGEILVVLVVALIVLGPTRLPDAARSLGRAVSEFRRVTSGFQSEVRDAFDDRPPAFPAQETPPPPLSPPPPPPEEAGTTRPREPRQAPPA